ncbi:hypothetical protein L3Q82_020378 [Scortum barcoo]|uniref:Uncharacterized protein n=1 Tax=Scortum barcoo TaxID=214431 RepID=A0ACB8V7B3_9TELE|nr:hypothetical protein L3Q82_020378 [Scortum barcoo]
MRSALSTSSLCGCCGAVLADMPLQHCMEVGDSASRSGKPGWWSLFLKRGTGECVPNYRGITLLSLPGRSHARVLERRIRPIVDPRIQEEQCGFRPWSWNTGPTLYSPCRVLEGLWEFAQPVHMCFCGSGEGIRLCPSWYSVGGAPRVRFLGVARGRRESGLGTTGFHLCFLRMMLSCWLHQARTFSMCWSGLQPSVKCEAAGMRISTSKSEAMVLDRKRVACPLPGWVERSCLKVEEFKYLGVLFTSEGKMERENDRRIGAASAVMRSVYRTVVVKKELSRKVKLSRFTGPSTFPPSPMVMNFG